MADYYAEFDTLVVSLPKKNVGDLIYAFMYGLKISLCPLFKIQMAQKEALSLAEAIMVAVYLEKYVKE